jgi:hypothetical protein
MDRAPTPRGGDGGGRASKVRAAARARDIATAPPPRVRRVARARVVSWLRAAALAFPAVRPVAANETGWVRCHSRERASVCPLQWRGRTGVTPVSVSRTRVFGCSSEPSPRSPTRQPDYATRDDSTALMAACVIQW